MVGLLVAVLGRSNVELLALAATFLRRLSVYAGNKAAMAAAGAVPALLRLLPAQGPALLAAVLRLLHNLSFDAELRGQMVAGGLIQKVRRTGCRMGGRMHAHGSPAASAACIGCAI